MNFTYIYCITNIDNNPYNAYIGKTTNFQNRKYSHLQTYGNNIIITIIDKVKEDWNFWEKYWIEQFKCWGYKLFNRNKGGGGPEYRTPENLKIIVGKLKKPIQQFDSQLNLIKEWPSIKEAKEKVGGNIDGCLRGIVKSAKGFFWKHPHQDLSVFNTTPRKGKKVLQYDMNRNLLNTYHSTREAERILNNSGGDNIGACCRGKQKTAYGYIWEYE